MSEQTIALRYLGGAYIHGVPARDLTPDEAAEHGALIEEQQQLTGMKLYEPVAPAQAAKVAKVKEASDATAVQ